MAVIWMDGFDHYGTDKANMLDGVYAEVSANHFLTNVNPRTGALSLSNSGGSRAQTCRRVLGGAKTTVIVGWAAYLVALPVSNNTFAILQFRNVANAIAVTICLQSTGVIEVFRGETTESLGVTASPALVAGAYQHVEAKVVFSATVGTVEIRVNGVTVLSLTGKNTTSECSQLTFGNGMTISSHGVTAYYDDLFVLDDSGTENNDFLGDRRVRTLFPNGNTASAGWTAVGAASGYECIDEAAPDDETTYIEAAGGTTPTSEFDLEDLPAVGAVAAVQTYVRVRKTNAGTANLQASLVSGASVDAGTDRPITEVYTYWSDVSELDPATGTPWTQSAVNSAKLRIARTA